LEPNDPHLQARILEHTNGLGAALVLEAAGTPSSLETAVAVARKGGKIVILGVLHEAVALNFRMVQLMEKHLLGSVIYQRQDFADAIQILAGGGLEPERHITAEIPLHAIVSHGFVPLSEQRAAHIKIYVYPRA
jgi:threonine dehydrogenase-like Zn-dependent dehydrogenase